MDRTASRPNFVIPFVLLLAAAACFLAWPSIVSTLSITAPAYTAPVVEPATRAIPIAPVYHDHATVKHGTDADAVRECLENQGPVSVWEKLNSTRDHRICVLPDGRIGDQIVQLDDDGVWHEITSFVRNESTMGDVMRALAREARLVWPK